MINFELTAELRSDTGKGASRRLRRANRVPGIIYGMGKEPTPVAFSHDELQRALQHEAFYAHVLTVKLGDQSEKAVLRDVQRHPAKPLILHIDLQRVSESEKIRVHVPFHFLGADVAPGVKQGGGMVFHAMVDAEVECLPKDLPEFINVDVSNLNLGESIHLSEIKLPEGVVFVELAHGHDPVVVTIHGGRMAAAEEEAAGEAAPEA